MRWTSFVGGILVLTLMDVVLAPDAAGNYTAAGRAGGAISLVGSLIQHIMSPAVPLIGDHTKTSSSTGPSASSATLHVVPPTAPSAPLNPVLTA